MIVPILVALSILTVVYLVISIWSRSVRKEKLEEEWDEDIRTGDRDHFIEEGLRNYDKSLRRKLILGVYVVPVVIALALVYAVNFM